MVFSLSPEAVASSVSPSPTELAPGPPGLLLIYNHISLLRPPDAMNAFSSSDLCLSS